MEGDNMIPIRPKFEDRIKTEVNISKRTKEILVQYAKFNKYSEGEIIDKIVSEILQDDEKFVKWLKSRRYSKKIDEIIFQNDKGDLSAYEEVNETCDI
jgi:hypothetical protein